MDWISLAGSLVAVVIVVLVVRGLGMGKVTLDDPDEACTLARHMVGGFRPVAAVLCAKGAAALVEGESHDFVVLKRLGSQFAARRISPDAQATVQGNCLTIDSGDYFFGHVALAFETPAEAVCWRDRLRTTEHSSA